jgi:CheY-like chemotaxis protein
MDDQQNPQLNNQQQNMPDNGAKNENNGAEQQPSMVIPTNQGQTESVTGNESEKPKILLAEDEDDARMIYLDILGDDDFEVDAAENGQKTLDHLAGKVYDLLLLDIIMPDMDGISVLSEIKKYPAKYGTSKIVMLTNIGGDLAIEKALSMGANGYMLKSETDPEELVRIIKKYLSGEEHVKPEKTLLDS